MPITYKQEFLATVEEEIKPLLEKHWHEIAVNKENIKLNPDWHTYHLLEDANVLKIFTARNEGVLVGYFVVLVKHNIHYKDHLFATNDVLFLSEDFRKGRTGVDLLKFAENCLKEDGVSVLTINTKCHKPFDRLLDWLGYTQIERVYSKYLRS